MHEWTVPPRLQKGIKVALGLALATTLGLAHAFPDGFAVGLTVTMGAGLAVGLTFDLNVVPVSNGKHSFDRRGLALGLAVGLAVTLVVALMAGLASTLVVRLVYGLAYGLLFLLNIGPAPVYRKPFDRRGLVLGLVVGLTVASALGHWEEPTPGATSMIGTVRLVLGLAYGMTFALVGGLTLGLLGVGRDRERMVADSPREAIRASGRLGLALGLLAGVLLGLAEG